jgi:beta-galactosidase
MSYIYTVTGIQPGPKTPEGVYARVVDGRTLFVNTTGEEKSVPISTSKTGIISNQVFQGSLVLGPMEAEILE